MGKKDKEHRKKVAKRNEKITQEKKKSQKNVMDFLMKMIQKEKDKGLFDGPVQPMPGAPENNTDGMTPGEPIPSVTPTFDGPQI